MLASRVLVQRCEQESDKNAGMLKALVRANPSYSASALSSLLGFKDKDDSCKYRGLKSRLAIVILHTRDLQTRK